MPPRRVLLVQMPIPPLGPAPVRGNVPLAGAYLKLFAEGRGLGADYSIEVLPAGEANTLGDQALAATLAARAVAGRLHLLPLEHRAHPVGGPRAEAPAAGRKGGAGRPGDHRRQRLGARRGCLLLLCEKILAACRPPGSDSLPDRLKEVRMSTILEHPP